MTIPGKLTRPPTLRWIGGVEGCLEILDQRRLPTETVFLQLHTPEDVWHAIRTLAVRGAPAIGVTAAFGMVLAARAIPCSSQSAVLIDLQQAFCEWHQFLLYWLFSQYHCQWDLSLQVYDAREPSPPHRISSYSAHNNS